MSSSIQWMIFITCLSYFSSSSAEDKPWGRDSVYKCDEGYTVSFHQTEHTNEVVLLKDDVMISSQSNPHQDNITNLDGISITSTDLTDYSELTAMTEQQRLKNTLRIHPIIFYLKAHYSEKIKTNQGSELLSGLLVIINS